METPQTTQSSNKEILTRISKKTMFESENITHMRELLTQGETTNSYENRIQEIVLFSKHKSDNVSSLNVNKEINDYLSD